MTHDCPGCHEHEPLHPFVEVNDIQIDEKLAPLIRILWSLGIRTDESCQEDEHHGNAHIGFPDLDNAHKFIHLLAAGNLEYAYDFEFLDDVPSENGFRVTLWYQGMVGPDEVILIPSVNVEFATDLIEELTDGVRDHLMTSVMETLPA